MLDVSKKSGKPIFALFQEIPGCAGCRQFGQEVLSNPLLVEAIESEFAPLLIHNNKAGRDAEVLKQFAEPAWNYQVVRFLDAGGKDIIPRKDRVWDTGGIAARMISTLEQAKRPVPAYLRLLSVEHSPRLLEAVFAMHCFWAGEMHLGQIDGVVITLAGFVGGLETVSVRYDPGAVTLPALVVAAEKAGCRHLDGKQSFTAAPDSDQKKQLQGTVFAKLKLTPAQATRANAWLRGDDRRALGILTPHQLKDAGQ